MKYKVINIIVLILLIGTNLIGDVLASEIYANKDIPERVIINVGENPATSFGISWQNNLQVINDKLFIIKKKKDILYIESYSELNPKSTILSFSSGETQKRGYQLRVTNLEEDTEYLYKAGNSTRWTTPKIIKTLKYSKDLTIGFLGDLQGYKQEQYDNLRDVYEQLVDKAGSLDVTLYAGDIVDDSNLLEQWTYLDVGIGSYMSESFSASSIGNHDNKDKGHVFINSFIGPDNGVKGLLNRNYYFEAGDAIIAVFDTESTGLFKEQKKWLEDIMEKTEKKFKIVLMHRSVYPMSYDELWIRELADTFDKAEIDLVLSGHDHIYSRTTMLHDKKVENDKGVTYVVGGSGSGSKFYKESSIQGGRYWKDVVYDDDYPVFSIIRIYDGILHFESYCIVNSEVILLDRFIKK